ncbi:hypothetical protein B0T16DRAFT_388605 [Cercophora newfieldiana]|uniref:Uncharacterized protein n=1 Tax=Cercophora newfieldiana TaxID=92897 RepID=A0AA39Y964_9PEZI|nr:hypothetical protein B0T16DRAFT_388605 [Cercophora newfieldiana]
MQLPQLLLGLAATASAIDLYMHVNGCYTNPALVCVNANPDRCCAGSVVDFFETVSARAIPPEWAIQVRGHSGGECRGTREVSPARGVRDKCLSNGDFSGVGYGFNARKRSPAPQEQCAAEGGCTSSQKPDFLLLEDGSKYSVVDLGVDGLVELRVLGVVIGPSIKLAINGANATGIPAEFAALKVE